MSDWVRTWDTENVPPGGRPKIKHYKLETDSGVYTMYPGRTRGGGPGYWRISFTPKEEGGEYDLGQYRTRKECERRVDQ